MKNYLLAGAIATLLLLVGCSGSPKPSKADEQPTLFVQSHTPENFKDITPETAVWNGIAPEFLTDKRYIRCDMTEEAMVTFVKEGNFKIIFDKKKADYTLEVTMLSCSAHKAYQDNRIDVPMKEKALYQDFMRWVEEEDPEDLPKGAKKIAQLIKDNKPEGFKRFYNEKYIHKYGQTFDYSENWGHVENWSTRYINQTKGVMLPSKYYGMSDEDKEILKEVNKNKKAYDDKLTQDTFAANGNSLMSSGATLGALSNSGNLGGAMMGAGVVLSLFSTPPPVPVNEFKVTNNRNGKSWKQNMRFSIAPQSWRKNIIKPMNDWTYDEIPWSDLD